MSSVLFRQTWALIRRYGISLLRSPVASISRLVLLPVLLIGLVIYLLIRNPDQRSYLTSPYVPIGAWVLTSYTLYHFCSRLIVDNETGFKSLMICMGLKREAYYLGYALSYIAYALPIMITIGVLSLTFLMVKPECSPLLIFSVFMLFVVHTTALIFVFASVITSTRYTSLILLLLLADQAIPYIVFNITHGASEEVRPWILFFASMSPFESIRIMCEGYLLCKNCDTTKVSNMYVSQPVPLILAAMTFWSSAAFLFAFWFNEVCPWQHESAAKNPFFCCYFKKSHGELKDTEMTHHKSKYFEDTMKNREVGIRLSELTKSFNGVPAVNDVSFDIYKGETTLLLGHNGAGKTTLMNIVLGKLTPDRGGVRINQHSAHSGDSAVGICPQNSVLDENLSVMQHLTLFSDIKASFQDRSEYENHIRGTINDVGLTNHSDKVPSELSGGMKRKLSLALAFAGKSSVLILDEPSSGLDPDSRVFIWNAIRRYRSDRTVLLSTQHMEEADYLGDRVAIMSEGKIVCCGSSTFLNDILGNAYKIRVECRESKREQVLEFIRRYFNSAKQSEVDQVADSTVSDSINDPVRDVVIELTDNKSKDTELKLIEMLEEIEANHSTFYIESYGLKSSSIEDVLLNTNKIFHQEPTRSVQLTVTSTSDHIATLTSLPAPRTDFLMTQLTLLLALFKKHIHTYKRDWHTSLFYRVLIPTYCVSQLVSDMNGALKFPKRQTDIYPAFMVFHFIYYPTLERVSKFKTMQLTSYANFVHYWLAFILSDLLSISVMLFGVYYFLDGSFYGKFLVPQEIVFRWAALAVLLFGLSAATLAYLLSMIFSDPRSAMGYYFLIYAVSPSLNAGIFTLKVLTLSDLNWLSNITAAICTALFPADALQYIFYGFSAKCYVESRNTDYPCSVKAGLSPVHSGIIALAVQLISHCVILYLLERNNIDVPWYFRWRNISSGRKEPLHNSEYESKDEDVLREKSKAIKMIRDPQSQALVAANLSKSHTKGVKAVDQLSFTVARGECFGLLGVNGAGKSTTFSMLVAESKPDTGELWASGHYSTENVNTYRCNLGYDPQSNPEMSLSSEDALYLMARLRKVDEKSIPKLVQSVLDLLCMNEHANKPANVLSGGTKRKLALGMSLIGNPLLLALDEPTAGVDPVARRSIWQLLRSLRRQIGSSIIISSHAMEECEAICDRISIMARGRLRCIGTFLHLRSKFSQICTVKVNFSNNVQSNSTNENTVDNIVTSINHSLQSSFGSSVKLVDSNLNSATFNLSQDKLKRSILFKILREFKQKNPHMSYMVNDSSLEDIFITLAREQQELEQQQATNTTNNSSQYIVNI